MDIYLIRHGQTAWNVEGRFQGRKDSPLTAEGISQASALAHFLKDKKIQKMISSPAGRALQTARIFQDTWGCSFEKESRLLEIHLGDWEGLLKKEIQETNPHELENFRKSPQDFRSPGGEDFFQVRHRLASFWQDLCAKKEAQTIALVSHGVAIQSLLALLDQRPVEDLWSSPVVHQTSVSLIQYRPSTKETKIVYAGKTDHLDKTTPSPLGV